MDVVLGALVPSRAEVEMGMGSPGALVGALIFGGVCGGGIGYAAGVAREAPQSIAAAPTHSAVASPMPAPATPRATLLPIRLGGVGCASNEDDADGVTHRCIVSDSMSIEWVGDRTSPLSVVATILRSGRSPEPIMEDLAGAAGAIGASIGASRPPDGWVTRGLESASAFERSGIVYALHPLQDDPMRGWEMIALPADDALRARLGL